MTARGSLEVEGPSLRGTVGAETERGNAGARRGPVKQCPEAIFPVGEKTGRATITEPGGSKISSLLRVALFFCLESIFG